MPSTPFSVQMGCSLAELNHREKEERVWMGNAATSATKAALYMKGLMHFMWSGAELRWQRDIWNTDEHIFLMEAGIGTIPL